VQPFVVDPRFPWIQAAVVPETGAYALLDTRTGARATALSEKDVVAFVAAHSAAPQHGGLGDAIRGLTRRLGFGECTPCAKRQAALNARFPRVFRR